MPLPKTLPITAANGEAVELTLNSGEPVFVLGANGTGKSALLVKMAERLGAEVLRIVASRPLVVENDSSQITTSQVLGMRDNYRVWDSQLAFRAKPPNAGQRAQL